MLRLTALAMVGKDEPPTRKVYRLPMERDQTVITTADIVLDGMAMHEAALEHDWSEVRFRCHLIAKSAEKAGMIGVGLAALAVEQQLGLPGYESLGGYAEAMRDLSDEIDALPSDKP